MTDTNKTQTFDSNQFDNINKNDYLQESFQDVKKDAPIEEKMQNRSFFCKIQSFAKRNIDYLVSAGTIFLLLMLVLIVNGDRPFGKNCFLISDSYEQVIAFFNHFFNIFEGKSTLFYSNFFGKGIEIFSTLEYMFLNPFYIIVLLGGRANMELMFTFSAILMLIFNALILIWFARKYFLNVNWKWRVLISIFYAFSGYISYSYAFLTWIIYPSIVLIVADRFLSFLKTGKLASFIASLVWYVIACYSVGISTVIILFVLMTGYIMFVKEKPERPKYFTGLFVVFLCAGLISLVILFPSVIDIFNTDRSSSFLKNLLGSGDNGIINKIGIIFLDALVVILSGIYIVKCNKKDKLNQFLLFALIILFLPVIFDSILRILCFSKYQGFCNRFYFLNEALLFILALSVIDKGLFKVKECKTETVAKVLISFMLFMVALVFIALIALNYKGIGSLIKSPLYKGNQLTFIFFSFFMILLFIFAVVLLLNWRKIFGKKAVNISLSIIIAFSLLFNFLVFTSDAKVKVDEKNTIIENSNITGNMKFFNCPVLEGLYNSYFSQVKNTSVFTSLVSNVTTNSYKKLGYLTGNVYTNTATGTLISDSIMGLKYYVTDKKHDRPYLSLIYESENCYIYENQLASNGTIILDSEFSFDDDLSAMENFTRLKNYFGIEGELLETVSFNAKQFTEDDGTEKLKIDFTADKEGILYLNGIFNYPSKNDSITIDEFSLDFADCYQDVAYLRENENYVFNLRLAEDKDIDDIRASFLNYEVAKQLCEKIIQKQTEFEFTKDGYKVNFNISDNEKLYVLVPSIDGLSYILNGKKIETVKVLGGMASFTSNELKNVLIAKYSYPNTKLWIIFSIFAIVVVALVLTLYHFTKFKHIQKIIEICMKIVVGLILMIVYCAGTLLSIVWFFV